MSLWALSAVSTKHRRRTPTLADTYLRDPSFGLHAAEEEARRKGGGGRGESPPKGVLKKSVFVVDPYSGAVGEIPTDADDFTQTIDLSPRRSPTKREQRATAAGAEKEACSCQWEWGWSSSCPLHGASARTAAKLATSQAVTGDGGGAFDGTVRWESVEPVMEMHAREGGYEVQRHAGVGSAVAGVRKDERGEPFLLIVLVFWFLPCCFCFCCSSCLIVSCLLDSSRLSYYFLCSLRVFSSISFSPCDSPFLLFSPLLFSSLLFSSIPFSCVFSLHLSLYTNFLF